MDLEKHHIYLFFSFTHFMHNSSSVTHVMDETRHSLTFSKLRTKLSGFIYSGFYVTFNTVQVIS